MFVFFFFSSRRRHTRCSRDWSSDVCSSDLVGGIEGFLKQQPAVEHVVSLVGLDFIQNANQTNAAIIFVNMKPWDERTSRRDQINAVLGAVNGYLFGMRNARGFAFNLPEIIGLGTTAGLEM